MNVLWTCLITLISDIKDVDYKSYTRIDMSLKYQFTSSICFPISKITLTLRKGK